MTTIEQASVEAVLADISYLDGLAPDIEGRAYETLVSRRVTAPLAEQIAARFEVLAIRSDPASNYQGVVFRDRTTGELYLANRGTDPTISVPRKEAARALRNGSSFEADCQRGSFP